MYSLFLVNNGVSFRMNVSKTGTANPFLPTGMTDTRQVGTKAVYLKVHFDPPPLYFL